MAKKGLLDELEEYDIDQGSRWYFSDEMRFGLWGQVRRRWGLRGVKIIQPKQIEFIEVFYNRQRLHSSLGYHSPLAYETDHLS